MEHSVVSDLAICIVVAWILAVGAKLLRQPLILAYLAGGFLIGPIGLKLVSNRAAIETISQLGLILLLFMIGLEIDLKKIKSSGRLITFTALNQIIGGCLLGVIFFRVMGFPLAPGAWDALYLAVTAALSSTVIIVKLLYEKSELDTLSGRLTLGVLVLQDLFAILFLAVQPNLNEAGFGTVAISMGKVMILVAVAFTASRYALPPIFRTVARLPELVLVGALAWCFLIAGLASTLHLSAEMGALIAGVAISTFPYTLDVSAKITSLRDFFVTLFFVGLGMAIPKPTLPIIGWAFAVALFLVASRILTVFPCLYIMRQGLRASLLPAVNLCQVSELSLVVLALGAGFQHISPQTQGIVAYAFVLLGVASAYTITKSDSFFRKVQPMLKKIGLRDLDEDTLFKTKSSGEPKIFLLGFCWTASSLLEELTRHSPELLPELRVVDFNPNVNIGLRKRHISVIYGDITQRDTLLHAGIEAADLIVCTIPNTLLKGATNLRLARQLRELNKTATLIMHAEFFHDVPQLYQAGADYVSVPRLVEARAIAEIIRATRAGLLKEQREKLDAELLDRSEVVP
ncbi:MAG: cation:proton antiporter [Verrucomicrobiota bacterium]|nr:cation:proton antiporter [Verrucomicrobiota bacterium]